MVWCHTAKTRHCTWNGISANTQHCTASTCHGITLHIRSTAHLIHTPLIQSGPWGLTHCIVTLHMEWHHMALHSYYMSWHHTAYMQHCTSDTRAANTIGALGSDSLHRDCMASMWHVAAKAWRCAANTRLHIWHGTANTWRCTADAGLCIASMRRNAANTWHCMANAGPCS